MALSSFQITTVRSVSLAMVGLCCLTYAVLAMAQDRPDPFLWYVPGVAGILASIGIFISFALAGRQEILQATDELYRMVNHRAQRHSYWVALALYPLFAVLRGFDVVSINTSLAAMGTLTGASYLLLVTLYEWRLS